jgi:type IV secretory pathway TrbF-like protein
MRNPFDRARSEAPAIAVSKEIDNPYLAARREWNERNGDYIAQAHNSRVLAIVFAFTTVVSVSTSVYLATRSKFIPFVVKVDTLGLSALSSRVGFTIFGRSTSMPVQSTNLSTNVTKCWPPKARPRQKPTKPSH